MSLKPLFRQIALNIFEKGDAVIPDDIVKAAQRDYPDEFASESARMVRNAAKREVTDVLKSFTEDDDNPQLSLPGLSLPSVIAIPVEGDFVYKPSPACTWDELVAGGKVRDDHVVAAQAHRDEYYANLTRLRPYMEGTALKAHEAARELLRKAS